MKMRLPLTGTAFLCLLMLCCGFEKKWKAAESGWDTRVETAVSKAKARGKYVLVLKTGLEQDPASRRMLYDVLSSRVMRRYLRDNMETVCLDFSINSKMPFQQARYNHITATRLGFPDTTPAMVILNGQGTVIARMSGYIPLSDCMTFFKDIIPYSPVLNNTPTKMWSSAFFSFSPHQKNKKYLILLTGSDRGGDCSKLQNNVLSHEKFYHFVRKHFLLKEYSNTRSFALMYVDFPLRKKFSPKEEMARIALLKRHKINLFLPTLAVYDRDTDKVIAQHSGYLPIDDCLKFLKDALDGKSRPPQPTPKDENLTDATDKNQRMVSAAPPVPPHFQQKLRQTRVVCTGWGHKKILFSVLNGMTEAKQNIVLEIKYGLPAATKAQIFIQGENAAFLTPSRYLSGSGTFLCQIKNNTRTKCRKLSVYIRYAGEAEKFLLKEIPCSFTWR